jgi:outer membrane lipoprotein-sorting protein
MGELSIVKQITIGRSFQLITSIREDTLSCMLAKTGIIVFSFLFLFISLSFCQALSPEMLIHKFEEAISKINDYQCCVREWCYNGNDFEKRTMRFYFKKPSFIRTDIVSGNRAFDAGSVAVFSGGNKVKGRKGGILCGIVLEIDKKDSLATSIRGIGMDDADLDGILFSLKLHLTISVNTVTISDGLYCLTGISKDPKEAGGITRQVIYLDTKSLLPVRMEGFEGDRQVAYSEWSNYIVNSELPVELFDARFDSKGFGKICGTESD